MLVRFFLVTMEVEKMRRRQLISRSHGGWASFPHFLDCVKVAGMEIVRGEAVIFSVGSELVYIGGSMSLLGLLLPCTG